VSTGGWKGIERAGDVGNQTLTLNQIQFMFWCLGHTPHISKKPVIIECEGKKYNRKTLTLEGGKLLLEPVQYPRIKCPSIRFQWVSEKRGRGISASQRPSFSTDVENAYWVEWGMGQQMVHIAGSIAQVGVNMIGGVDVDLVPMVPYLSLQPPKHYRKGNLPNPRRDGENSAVECIEKWQPSGTFNSTTIPQSKLGQLLWAGYGCTPHKTFRHHRFGTLGFEGQGKTIPSASAIYTTSLYVAKKDGIFKYINWNEEENVAIHSLGQMRKGEPLKKGECREGAWMYTGTGHLLEELRQCVPELPTASTYIIVASNGRLPPFFSLMEAGYSLLHIVLQAQALGISSNLIVNSQEQMNKLQRTIGFIDVPIALIPIGQA
jgi:hypothetical protein